LEYVENNLQQMKVKSWRLQAVDREEWESAVKEVKALRGPYSQGVSECKQHTATDSTFSCSVILDNLAVMKITVPSSKL
jgi:hypothetical protein